MDIILLIGRVLFGSYFLYNAYKHFAYVEGLAAYAGSKHVPHPKLAVLGSGVLLFVGGLSIMLAVRVGILGWALVLFLVPVTYQMHAFWKEQGDAHAAQEIQFTKNVALLGAVLMIIVLYR